jgi:hypothetical protein
MKTHIRSRIVAAWLLTFAITAIVGITISARNGLTDKIVQKVVPGKTDLVVHEWGTFTSIAGKDGVALEWRPLNGPTDLPKFVYTIQQTGQGLRHGGKADLRAAVRMETPVLYFYSANEMDVAVKVDFPKGKITEWYPQARSVNLGIDWGRLKVMPYAAVSLPVEYSPSHYYPARDTDSAPVQVCSTDGKPAQQEKFLFYRGVGNFDLPLSVKLKGDNIVLKNLSKDEISRLIIFENRGGKIGYRMLYAFTGETVQARPAVDMKIDFLLPDLKETLVASGLYEKEADAMIKTWRDNWFEEGMRVFYVLPRKTTDAVLPITIEPRPANLVRVLVGRAEVITPEMEKSVQKQVSLLSDPSSKVRETAMRTIRNYGRFSEPILKRILANERDDIVRERIRQLIETTAAGAD